MSNHVKINNDSKFNTKRIRLFSSQKLVNYPTSPLFKWKDEIRKCQTNYYQLPYFMRGNPKINDIMISHQYKQGD